MTVETVIDKSLSSLLAEVMVAYKALVAAGMM